MILPHVRIEPFILYLNMCCHANLFYFNIMVCNDLKKWAIFLKNHYSNRKPQVSSVIHSDLVRGYFLQFNGRMS